MPGFGLRISGNTITSTATPHVSSIVFLATPPSSSTITTATTVTVSGGAVLFGKSN